MERENSQRFHGYRRVAKAYPWVAIKRDNIQKVTETKGKIVRVHADGTYRVRYQDGEINEKMPQSHVVAKLAGSRESREFQKSSLYQKGDTIKCRHVSAGGRAQVAWHNPRTQEVRWDCPQPADRILYEFESTAPMARA